MPSGRNPCSCLSDMPVYKLIVFGGVVAITSVVALAALCVVSSAFEAAAVFIGIAIMLTFSAVLLSYEAIIKYKPIETNVDNLKSAKIICLAEAHNESNYHRRNADVIADLYQEGDIILAEQSDSQSVPADKLVRLGLKDSVLADKKLVVKGWDSHSIREEISAQFAIFQKEMKDLEGALEKANWEGSEARQLLSGKIEKLRSGERKDFCKSELDGATSGWFLCLRQVRAKYTYELLTKSHEIYQEFADKLEKTFIDRQKAMMNNITNTLTKDNKIFVIGGGLHFYILTNEEQPQAYKEGVALIQNFLKKHPYAIFGYGWPTYN